MLGATPVSPPASLNGGISTATTCGSDVRRSPAWEGGSSVDGGARIGRRLRLRLRLRVGSGSCGGDNGAQLADSRAEMVTPLRGVSELDLVGRFGQMETDSPSQMVNLLQTMLASLPRLPRPHAHGFFAQLMLKILGIHLFCAQVNRLENPVFRSINHEFERPRVIVLFRQVQRHPVSHFTRP